MPSLVIKNLAHMADVSIDLGDLTILVGAQGTGKSLALQWLKAAVDGKQIDEAFARGHEKENRWDYLLGHEGTQKIFGLEPHTANNHEITTVILKRRRAIEQLAGHLRPGVHVADWFWVASGRVDFLPFEKAQHRLASGGIQFVGKSLLKKHLPASVEQPADRAGAGARARRSRARPVGR